MICATSPLLRLFIEWGLDLKDLIDCLLGDYVVWFLDKHNQRGLGNCNRLFMEAFNAFGAKFCRWMTATLVDFYINTVALAVRLELPYASFPNFSKDDQAVFIYIFFLLSTTWKSDKKQHWPVSIWRLYMVNVESFGFITSKVTAVQCLENQNNQVLFFCWKTPLKQITLCRYWNVVLVIAI